MFGLNFGGMDADLFPALKVIFSPLMSTTGCRSPLPKPTKDSISGRNRYIKPAKMISRKTTTLNFNIFVGIVE